MHPKPGRLYPNAGNLGGNHRKWYVVAEKKMRPPKEGEHYLSGAIPEVYVAAADMATAYYIMVEVERIDCRACHGTGNAAGKIIMNTMVVKLTARIISNEHEGTIGPDSPDLRAGIPIGGEIYVSMGDGKKGYIEHKFDAADMESFCLNVLRSLGR